MKKTIKTQDLCKGLPEEIGKYLDYCKKLTFEETPDYEKMKFFFLTFLIKQKLQYDLKFSYLNKTYLSKFDRYKRKESFSTKKKKNIFEKIFSSYREKNSKEKNIQPKINIYISNNFVDKIKQRNVITLPNKKCITTMPSEKSLEINKMENKIIKSKTNNKVEKNLGMLKSFQNAVSKKEIIGNKIGLNTSHPIRFINFQKKPILFQRKYNYNKERVKNNLFNENKTETKNISGQDYKGKLFKGIFYKRLFKKIEKNPFFSKSSSLLNSKV